jgi:hypothetical protein
MSRIDCPGCYGLLYSCGNPTVQVPETFKLSKANFTSNSFKMVQSSLKMHLKFSGGGLIYLEANEAMIKSRLCDS